MALVEGEKFYDGPGGFDRGFQATVFHSNMWVRGNAKLDTSTGMLVVTIGCETDSVAYGPRGHLEIVGFDAHDNHVFTAVSSQFAIGGKRPGKARIESKELPAMHVDNAGSVTRLAVRPHYDDYCPLPFGLDSVKIDFTWHF